MNNTELNMLCLSISESLDQYIKIIPTSEIDIIKGYYIYLNKENFINHNPKRKDTYDFFISKNNENIYSYIYKTQGGIKKSDFKSPSLISTITDIAVELFKIRLIEMINKNFTNIY